MLFNTPAYGLFLLAVLAGYAFLSHRGQNRFLLAASYLFYSFWDVRFLSLIILSTAVDFVAGRWIADARQRDDRRAMRLGLGLSLTTNLGILGFFKYAGFFVESAAALLTAVGLPTSLPVLSIILPVGISFYTFQTLSYTIDIYRGTLEPVDNLVDFALFVAFFPQLVAGPIERAARLLPQIRTPRMIRPSHWQRGLYLILVGLVRKVVIADTAGAIVDGIFARPAAHTSLELLAGLLLYALQIYGDFTGYSNIARGSAQLLGFELIRNFRHPYFATSPADLWRRWHISLSTWLRDYLYIPLGGNRRGPRRTYLNLMLTMLLGGLWHGASWSFVFWGALHGLYLAVHRAWRGRFPSRAVAPGPLHTGLAMTVTFTLTCFAWLFFRAPDLATVGAYLNGLAALHFDGQTILAPLIFLLLLLLTIDLPQHRLDDEFCFLRLPPVLQGALAGAAIVLLFMSGTVHAPFIYFQF